LFWKFSYFHAAFSALPLQKAVFPLFSSRTHFARSVICNVGFYGQQFAKLILVPALVEISVADEALVEAILSDVAKLAYSYRQLGLFLKKNACSRWLADMGCSMCCTCL